MLLTRKFMRGHHRQLTMLLAMMDEDVAHMSNLPDHDMTGHCLDRGREQVGPCPSIVEC